MSATRGGESRGSGWRPASGLVSGRVNVRKAIATRTIEGSTNAQVTPVAFLLQMPKHRAVKPIPKMLPALPFADQIP